MTHRTTNRYLETLWEAITSEPPKRRDESRYDREIVRAGYVAMWLLEDALDLRIPWILSKSPRPLLDAAGIATHYIFHRPRAKDRATSGGEEISAADYAALLIFAERLGLAVDAANICELLRPDILKKPKITQSELHVLWHPIERGKMAPLTVLGEPCEYVETKKFTTATGYRARLSTLGGIMQMEVTKPARRSLKGCEHLELLAGDHRPRQA